MAAAAAATTVPSPAAAHAAGDAGADNCEPDARPWSPSSAEDYSDMPTLINASPGPGQPSAQYAPPALSPVRNFLQAPPQGSSEYPVQMDLDESLDAGGAMPPLLSVSDMDLLNWLGPSMPDPWTQEYQQQQQTQQQEHAQQQQERHQQQRQRQRHAADERSERLSLLNSFQQLRPPRATGQRSRPGGTRRTTGPQSARPAWAPAAQPAQPAQQDAQQEDASARSRRHIDALYATAVQQVWARTASLSADLLGWNPDGSSGTRLEQQLQPLLRPTGVQQRQQEEQQEHVQLQQVQQMPLPAELHRPPAHSSFLQPGMWFIGNQRLLQRGSLRQEDQWGVQVALHDVDYRRGRVSGSMRALDVAGAAGPIDTFFEGDIIDDLNNTFWTHAWGASRETDLRHWSKFDTFADIKPLVMKHGGRCGKLQQHPTIFMRWKEQCFVNTNEQCGLTIAGFYYVALDRTTGAMRGLYYDPSSSPFQELSLQVDQSSSSKSTSSGGGSSSSSSSGISFVSYSFA